MESYPGELLVGVFPLVFCVDVALPKHKEDVEANANVPQDPSVNDFDNPSQAPNFQPQKPSTSPRSQFDRFLDAVAASLMDEGEDHPLRVDGSSNSSRRKTEDVMMSLFRGDEDEDSDDEDNTFFSGSATSRMTSPIPSFDATDNSVSARRNRPTIGNPFRLGNRKGSDTTNMFGGPGASPMRSSSAEVPLNTSYAKALQQGQGFFQRARIVSINKRHGFPPSKDPTGENGRIAQYMGPKGLYTGKLVAAMNKYPIDGIISSGWLEKHAHSLPSVLIVVVPVACDTGQEEQDKTMLDTLENLSQSLASKRDCQLHIVGVVQDGVSMIQAEQWSQTLADQLEETPDITLLDAAELSNDVSSVAMKHLHKSVRDASLQYYLAQARRTKAKLQQLGFARKTPLLLPLAIRYCFKVAVFYEFQWKHEKSLKFMAEAYRYVETYYRYLVERRKEELEGTPPKPKPVKILNSQLSNVSNASGTENTEIGESVELTLGTPRHNGDEEVLSITPPPPAHDMVFQCRAVADWLNFKLLQAGFCSHTEGGLLAASTQWQKHAQAFTSPKSFVSEPWHDWSYVAHQRVVVGQLLERHPPKALGDLGNDFDEVLLRCSPWRTFEAAAEALLQVGVHVQRAVKGGEELSFDDLRIRYVGGLDTVGLAPKLQEEAKHNHREKALDCILRAISLFEHALEKEKAKDDEDNFREHSWSRSGARMYYLAGSILLGLGRHAEATPYLEKAIKYAKGWKGLELSIRRMLIECYEKHIPTQSSDQEESSQALASIILDSYFNAEMSNSHLRRALEGFSSLRGRGAIKWYRDCLDEADASLPFSFALTFPATTHATAGDSVQASVLVKSNLDYAVHINSVTLLSLAGEITIPSNDLLSAKNANEGSDGGIIVQANTEVLISTQLELPKDLDKIAVDETGNGGEKEGVAGKGSFAKSARPRTGGITAAAGARLVSETMFGEEGRPGNSQWSLRCLGGKPLKCDGMRLLFYPVYVAAGSDGTSCKIELTIEKKQPKTQAKIKRTPFEEDNYVASAWTRPRYLPLNRGPRCLRVLPPMADMIVTNLTDSYTNGKALEGTVNRILLKLTAGPQENCTDVQFRVSCSSLLLTVDGITKRITSEIREEDEKERTEDSRNPRVRTPVLVSRDLNAPAQMTEYGYELPAGWVLLGDGRGVSDTYSSVVAALKSGESTYAYFDLYRPSPTITRMEGVLQVGEQAEDLACELDMCQTEIDVSLCYRQERQTTQTKKLRRRGRRKPNLPAPGVDPDGMASRLPTPEEEAKADEDANPDLVFHEYTASFVWTSPLSAVFSPGVKQTFPSGNRHPSNSVPDPETGVLPPDDPDSELVLIDGERVTTKCVLEAASAADGLTAEIEQIRFEDNDDAHTSCNFKMLSGKNEQGLLFQADKTDPCRKLQLGSKFSFAWTTETTMKSDYLKGSVSSSLGVISVDWLPTPLELPDDMTFVESITAHGPLTLTTPCTCRFMGPPCYIENAPFETTIDDLPPAPRVAVPFDVVYRIHNKTSMEQKLKIVLNESEPGNEELNGFLVSGLVSGDISLSPFETHIISYTALPTRTGPLLMPQVSVSSDRFKTWVIKNSASGRRPVFVLP